MVRIWLTYGPDPLKACERQRKVIAKFVPISFFVVQFFFEVCLLSSKKENPGVYWSATCLVASWPQIMQIRISFQSRSDLVLDADIPGNYSMFRCIVHKIPGKHSASKCIVRKIPGKYSIFILPEAKKSRALKITGEISRRSRGKNRGNKCTAFPPCSQYASRIACSQHRAIASSTPSRAPKGAVFWMLTIP